MPTVHLGISKYSSSWGNRSGNKTKIPPKSKHLYLYHMCSQCDNELQVLLKAIKTQKWITSIRWRVNGGERTVHFNRIKRHHQFNWWKYFPSLKKKKWHARHTINNMRAWHSSCGNLATGISQLLRHTSSHVDPIQMIARKGPSHVSHPAWFTAPPVLSFSLPIHLSILFFMGSIQ